MVKATEVPLSAVPDMVTPPAARASAALTNKSLPETPVIEVTTGAAGTCRSTNNCGPTTVVTLPAASVAVALTLTKPPLALVELTAAVNLAASKLRTQWSPETTVLACNAPTVTVTLVVPSVTVPCKTTKPLLAWLRLMWLPAMTGVVMLRSGATVSMFRACGAETD